MLTLLQSPTNSYLDIKLWEKCLGMVMGMGTVMGTSTTTKNIEKGQLRAIMVTMATTTAKTILPPVKFTLYIGTFILHVANSNLFSSFHEIILRYIDTTRLVCLNEVVENSCKKIFKAYDKKNDKTEVILV
jgi:hypothetical protein